MKHLLALYKLLAIGAVMSTAIYVASPVMAQTIATPISTVDIQSGLVAHWQFNENTGNMTRDSIGNSSGELTNGPLWTQGKIGGGLAFDGIDDAVRITSSSQVNNVQAFTFTAWIYPTKNGGIIFRKGAGPTAFFNIYTTQEANVSNLPVGVFGLNAGYSGQYGSWQTQNQVSLNTWHQVVVTYTRSITATPVLYIDGVAQQVNQSSMPSGISITDDSKAFVGNNQTLSPNSSVFGGKIDEVRLYNRILSAQEILLLYQTESPDASRPNIIVIMSDDQADGESMDVMTNVRNLLSSKGIRFTNSFVDFPICCPSRTTFITGQHSQNHGVQDNSLPDGGYAKFHNSGTENNTLPVWLKNAGYKTALMGKYINGYGASDLGGAAVPPGWDRWLGIMNLGYFNYTVSDNGSAVTYGSSTSDYLTDVLSNKAVGFINDQATSTQPFFLWLTPYAPHNDPSTGGFTIPAPRHAGMFSSVSLPRPPSFNETDVSDKPSFLRDSVNPLLDAATVSKIEQNYRKRREALLALDEMVGNIVNALTAAGKLNDTVIVYTSDNGWFSGEHRIPAGKELMYEEAIRVPLIITGPGVSKGEERNRLVQNIDLTPTILELAHAVSGRAMDGRSLVPLLQNNSSSWRSTLLFQSAYWQSPYKQGAYKTATLKGVRTNQFAYVEHTPTLASVSADALSEVQELERSGQSYSLSNAAVATANPVMEMEFYDLRTDPYELENKFTDPAYFSVVEDLKSRLNILKTCAGDSCWMTTLEPGGSEGFNPNSPQPSTPPAEPYTPFPPRQMPDGTWVQPAVTPRNSFMIPLRFGMSNSDVTRLQTLLAQDPSLYPEGLVTGYFGTLTRQAVIRFQEKYAREMLQPLGLKRGTGFVGSATLRKLNELVK